MFWKLASHKAIECLSFQETVKNFESFQEYVKIRKINENIKCLCEKICKTKNSFINHRKICHTYLNYSLLYNHRISEYFRFKEAMAIFSDRIDFLQCKYPLFIIAEKNLFGLKAKNQHNHDADFFCLYY